MSLKVTIKEALTKLISHVKIYGKDSPMSLPIVQNTWADRQTLAILHKELDKLNQMAMHGLPDSPEEKIRKVKEATRREIERQKRLSPIQERMKRGQLEERIFPKRTDPSQVKKHNREVAHSITIGEAGNLYAIIVSGRGVRELSDLERKDLNPKHRSYLLHHVLDAPTMEKLISAVWRAEPEIRDLTGVTQRQAIHTTIKNLFI